MKIYFDENFPHQLANALQILESSKSREGCEVLNIADVFGKSTADEDWIPKIASEGGIVITQDTNIQRMHHQRHLYQKHSLGIIFIKPPSRKGYTYWELVLKVVNAWLEIKKISQKTKPPFAFVIRPRSKRLEAY